MLASVIHSLCLGLAYGSLLAIPLLLMLPGVPRRIPGALALALAIAAVPALAVAQDVDTGGIVGTLFPQVVPYLAIVPLVQVGALTLAKLPRLFGVTHGTVWERAWLGIAGLPTLMGFRATSSAQAAGVRR
jgi:hypothetical protein